MVSLGIVRPIVGGRQLLSWLLIGWIGMFALAPVQIEVTARSFAHPAVHLVAADDAGFGPFEQAVHVHECASATCSLWAPLLLNQAVVLLRDVKARLRAPDEDGAGLGPLDFERPPRGAAQVRI
ncbi:MAG TPA: hypothetical protein VGU72_27700 [Beijerinckiaceae bacterium]|jgi:hypothetical protein|nr:hypothetical protein [Beijerinckiaceae bacterium]